MLFALGFIAGLVVATFIAGLIALFKQPIESVTDRLYRDIQANARQVGLSQRGSIYIPRDDAEVARDEIIAENSAKGLDTNIEELR